MNITRNNSQFSPQLVHQSINLNGNANTVNVGATNGRSTQPPGDAVAPFQQECPPSEDFSALLTSMMQSFECCDGDGPPAQEHGSSHDPGHDGTGGGRDKQVAKGGRGNDKIVQKGGRGRDKQVAKGGRGNDKIVQHAGGGPGSSVVKGGRGNDQAVVKAGKNITVRDGSGKVLFRRGSGGNNVTVRGVEQLRVIDGQGKPLFSK